MIADKASGVLQWLPAEVRKPILSGLQGTQRAIKQPDIFSVNHQHAGELLRVQLTTSRSDFSRELALKKILRRFLAPLSPSLLSSRLHMLSPSPLPLLSSSPHAFISSSLFPPWPPSFFHHASKPLSSLPLSSLQINLTQRTVATPFLPQSGAGIKSVAGVQMMRAMDLNLKAITLLCALKRFLQGYIIPAPELNFSCSSLCESTSWIRLKWVIFFGSPWSFSLVWFGTRQAQ